MKSKNVLLGMAGVAMFSSGAMAQKPANIILINLDDSDRKSTRLNSSHSAKSRMPSSA